LGNFSLDVFDRKTDVVHPKFVQVANVRIGQWLGLPVSQELDFRSWRRVLQYERDVIGLDTWNTHVTGKRLSSNHNGHGFFDTQESEEFLGAVNIAHDERAVVEMFYHASTLRACLTAIRPSRIGSERPTVIPIDFSGASTISNADGPGFRPISEIPMQSFPPTR